MALKWDPTSGVMITHAITEPKHGAVFTQFHSYACIYTPGIRPDSPP